MAKKGGNKDNLVSLADRSTEEQRKIAAMGGKKSGETRREKILMSKIYADFLAGKYDIHIDEKTVKTISGTELVNQTIKAVLMQAEGPSVSMLKEIREATEGSKVTIDGELGTPVKFVFVEPPKNADTK